MENENLKSTKISKGRILFRFIKKDLIQIGIILVIMFGGIALFLMHDEAKLITSVKNGYIQGYDKVSIDNMTSEFFTNRKWESYKLEDGSKAVKLNCIATKRDLSGNPTKEKSSLEFLFSTNGKYIIANNIFLNGKKLDSDTASVMMEIYYEKLYNKLSIVGDNPGYVNEYIHLKIANMNDNQFNLTKNTLQTLFPKLPEEDITFKRTTPPAGAPGSKQLSTVVYSTEDDDRNYSSSDYAKYSDNDNSSAATEGQDMTNNPYGVEGMIPAISNANMSDKESVFNALKQAYFYGNENKTFGNGLRWFGSYTYEYKESSSDNPYSYITIYGNAPGAAFKVKIAINQTEAKFSIAEATATDIASNQTEKMAKQEVEGLIKRMMNVA